MTRRLRRYLVRFRKEDCGAAMVEFALVSVLFFFLIFAALDFGIFTSFNLMSEKATQVAARIAIARPAACPGVPERHAAGTLTPLPRYGTNCRAAANVCAAEAPVSCSGDASNPTASEIWARISPILPGGTEISDLTFTYTQDAEMGYLGGPYTAIVTVDLDLPAFSFISPVGSFIAALGGPTAANALDYRTISISLPAEDLASGTNG